MEMVQDEVVIEEPAPIDFNWCEEQETEEISNCGDIIFEQDIPASLEEEVVTNSGTDADYDDNSDFCNKSSSQNSVQDDNHTENRYHIPDTYVPPSNNPRSLLRKNFTDLEKTKKPLVKFKQTLMVNKSLLRLNQKSFSISPSAGTSLLKPQVHSEASDARKQVQIVEKSQPKTAPKFKQSVFVKWNLPHPKCQKRTKSSTKKQKEHLNDRFKSKLKSDETIVSIEPNGGKRSKKFVDLHGENITINHDLEDSVINDEETKPIDDIAAAIDNANVVSVELLE